MRAGGLAPPFAWRSGICGTCATGLVEGRVEDIEAPSAPLGDGEVPLGRATPFAGRPRRKTFPTTAQSV